jgi:hypothetical protein
LRAGTKDFHDLSCRSRSRAFEAGRALNNLGPRDDAFFARISRICSAVELDKPADFASTMRVSERSRPIACSTNRIGKSHIAAELAMVTA